MTSKSTDFDVIIHIHDTAYTLEVLLSGTRINLCILIDHNWKSGNIQHRNN